MLEALNHLFSCVCGQNVGHTWETGGMLLPLCQRCTGLYAGAGVAALAHLLLRPRITGAFLLWHGGFLLLMAPFGMHWVSQGPGLRASSGLLFGAGVFTFLWLPAMNVWRRQTPRESRWMVLLYMTALLATALGLPALAPSPSAAALYTVLGLLCTGAAALVLVISTDAALLVMAIGRQSATGRVQLTLSA